MATAWGSSNVPALGGTLPRSSPHSPHRLHNGGKVEAMCLTSLRPMVSNAGAGTVTVQHRRRRRGVTDRHTHDPSMIIMMIIIKIVHQVHERRKNVPLIS